MNIQDLFSRYWWILAIIVGIVLIYIYFRLDAYQKMKVKKVFSRRVLLLIFFIGGWYVWYKFGGETITQTANIFVPMLMLVYFTGCLFIDRLRYETQQIIAPNFHGSYSKHPKHVNGFYIFAIDTFNSGGLSWDFAKRILIVREETVELFDEGAITIAQIGFASKYELPIDVQQFVENNKFFKKAVSQCYYGWFDDIERVDWEFSKLKELQKEKEKPNNIYNLVKKELGVDNPKVSSLYWLYRNLSKSVGKQTEQYDSTVESVEKAVEHHKRIKDAYTERKEEGKELRGGYEEGY